MKKQKVIIFTIADDKNLKYAKGLENSLRKFHTQKEVEFKIYGKEYIDKTLKEDNQFFYKATPWIARELIEKYDLVIKMDADSVVTGKLDDVFKNTDYEVGTAFNYSELDSRTFGLVSVFNISPQEYYNCGFVAMRSKAFIDQWFKLCQSKYFFTFRFREQDLLNILCHYGDYRVRVFDDEKNFYGLSGKDFWIDAELEKNDLVVKFINAEGKEVAKRQIRVIHWGEGNTEKMNFAIRFSPGVSDYLNSITKYEKA